MTKMEQEALTHKIIGGAYRIFLSFPRKRDCPFTLSSGKSENKNPIDPVNPVK
jgi:hypothetical protein